MDLSTLFLMRRLSMVDMDNYRDYIWMDQFTMKQARVALDMIRDFHGRTVLETHGEDVKRKGLRRTIGVERWDKNLEYRVWLQEIVLCCETATDPEAVFTEAEWESLEAYALENTGIDESVVLTGHRFRTLHLNCSRENECVKIKDGDLKINHECRKNCLKKAVFGSGLFTVDELKQVLGIKR